MDFVDDDRVDGAKGFAGVGREEKVERLRCRDEDVGRLALEPRTFSCRCIAGPNRHYGYLVPVASRHGAMADAGERGPQVALDVDGERFERRNVDDPAALLRRRRRFEHQPIDAPEKCGQRLAAARRCEDQGRVAARDRRPSLHLRRRRSLERGPKPLRHRGMKSVQNVVASHSSFYLCVYNCFSHRTRGGGSQSYG